MREARQGPATRRSPHDDSRDPSGRRARGAGAGGAAAGGRARARSAVPCRARRCSRRARRRRARATRSCSRAACTAARSRRRAPCAARRAGRGGRGRRQRLGGRRSAPSGAAVEDLEVRGSGRRVITIDAGIRVISRRARPDLARARCDDVLYGIYGERAAGLRVDGLPRSPGACRPDATTARATASTSGTAATPCSTGNDVSRFRTASTCRSRTTHARRGQHARAIRALRTPHHVLPGQPAESATRSRATSPAARSCSRTTCEVERNDFVHNRGPRTYGLLLRDCSDGHFVDNRLVDNTIACSSTTRIATTREQPDPGQRLGRAAVLLVRRQRVRGERLPPQRLPGGARHAAHRQPLRRRTAAATTGARTPPYDLDGDGVSDVAVLAGQRRSRSSRSSIPTSRCWRRAPRSPRSASPSA